MLCRLSPVARPSQGRSVEYWLEQGADCKTEGVKHKTLGDNFTPETIAIAATSTATRYLSPTPHGDNDFGDAGSFFLVIILQSLAPKPVL